MSTGNSLPAGARFGPRSPWCILALAVAVCVGAFTLDGDFVYDDPAAIVNNPIVQGKVGALSAFSSSLWGGPVEVGGSPYRPLSALLWRAVWGIFPGSSRAYHALSLILHVLAVGLFWRLGRALGSEEGPLAVAAVLFAVHPAHAESVGSIVAQSDMLAACIGLVALEVCIRAKRFVGSAASVLLLVACLVKESAIPFAAGALLLLAFRDEPLGRRLRAGAAVLSVSIGFAIFQLSLPRAYENWNTSLSYAAHGADRLLLGAHLVGRVVAMLVAPSGFSPVHGYAAIDLSVRTLAPFALIGCAGLVAAAVGFGVAARRRSRTTLLTLIILFGTPLMISGFPVRMSTDLPERLLYSPSMAAGALASMLIFRWGAVRLRIPVATVIAVFLFAVGVFAQRTWRNDASLWEHAVRVEPKAIRGQALLAQVRHDQGRIEEAAWHQLLAAWINDSYPKPVSWSAVTKLEQDFPPLKRIAEAPGTLQPKEPCRLVHGLLGVYRRTLPEFEMRALQLFQQGYPGCFVPGVPGPAPGSNPSGALPASRS